MLRPAAIRLKILRLPCPCRPDAKARQRRQPQAARIYIGAGLVRFPYEISKTGERRMIEMVRPERT